MAKLRNKEGKLVDEDSLDYEDHLDRYLNPDDYDDDFNPLGEAIFRDTLGVSIDDIMGTDDDDIEETRATGGNESD